MTIRLTQYLSVIILFFLSQTINAANYYWIGGAGNWGDINHWATTSGGSTLHSFVPTPNDDVFFDGGSGFTAVSKVVTVNTNATCLNMTWSGALNNPSLYSSGNTINIHGSLLLQTGMTYNVTYTNLMSNLPGQTITTNGVSPIGGSFSFKGAGSYSFTDAFNVPNSTINFENGILNTNNQFSNIGSMISTTSNARTLNLGSSVITTNGPQGWYCYGPNLTLSAGTSTIIFNYNDASTAWNILYAYSGQVYNNLIFNYGGKIFNNGGCSFNSVLFKGNGYIDGNHKFNSLTLSAGKDYKLPTTTITVTTQFNANSSNCSEWINITTITPGQVGTIYMPATASVNVANAMIETLTGTGGAVFTASNSVNNGLNAGWVFTPPTINNLYWIGGNGSWNDPTHWSGTSGGPTINCLPGPTTNVFFDAGSGFIAGAETVTINAVAACRNITCNGSPVAPKISCPKMFAGTMNIYGSVILQTGMTYSVATYFKSSNSETILSNGVQFTAPEPSDSYFGVTFSGLGTWVMQDAFYAGAITIEKGHVNTNSVPVSIYRLLSNNAGVKTIALGSSIVTVYGASPATPTAWSYIGTINAGTSHIIIQSPSVAFISFVTYGNQTYYDLTFNNANADFSVYGSSNNFHNVLFKNTGLIKGSGNLYINSLTFSPNCQYTIHSAVTPTIASEFNATVSSCSGWIKINSAATGTLATIYMPATATVNVSSTILQDIRGLGGATFNAINSSDNGNNIGWTFSAISTNTLYWVGGAGNWLDGTHWSNINNGVFPSLSPCVPGPGDDVFFNNNSGFTTTSNTVTLNGSVHYCRSMTWIGANNNPVLYAADGKDLSIYGSLTLQTAMKFDACQVYFRSNLPTNTISSNGNIMGSPAGYSAITAGFYFEGTGTWTLTDNLSIATRNIFFSKGHLNTNSQAVSVYNFFDANTWFGGSCATSVNSKTLTLGSSQIIVGNYWFYRGNNAVLNTLPNSSITGVIQRFNAHNNHVYGNLVNTGTTNNMIVNDASSVCPNSKVRFNKIISLGPAELYGSIIADTLVLSASKIYKLESGKTHTVVSAFYPSGNPCFITFLQSTTSGVRSNLDIQSGNINYDYLNIKDVDATPSYTPLQIAGHGTDAGNNLNIVFAPTTTVGLVGLGPDIIACQSLLPLPLNTTAFYPNPTTTFTWTGGVTTSSLAVNASGTYTVKVNYGAACTVTDNIVVTVNPTPTITATGTNICGGSSTVLTAFGANTYTWVSPSATTNTVLVSPSTSTVYTIMGTSSAGCTNTLTNIPVTVNSTPTVAIGSITNGGVICNGNVVTITPSGAGVYTLSPTSQTTTTSFVLTPTTNTTYSIIGANAGCISNTANTTVTVNPIPTVAIMSVSSPTLCTGNSSTITPSGASTYTLTSGTTTLTSSPFVVSPTANTTYTIVGTSITNCASGNQVTSLITVNNTPTVAITSISNATLCSGNASTITASGATTYTLISSTSTLTGNPFVVSPNTNTTYTLVGSSAANCKSTNPLSTLITVNATPTITTSGASAGTICSGQVFTITPLGGNTGSYTLTPGNIITSTVFTVSPTTNTTYSINGTNTSGCLSTTSTDLNVPITVNATPTVAAVFSSNALCASQNVTITLSGANGIYTLSPGTLTTPSTTGSFVISPPAGTTVYTITANNSNGCVSTLANQIYTTSVSVVTNPTISVSAITPSVCSGSTASITPFGASSFTLQPNNITVSSGQTFTLVQTAPTTYTINGTATGGCVSIASTQFVTTVGINATPTIAIASISNASVCAGNQSIITPNGASSYTLFPDNITGTSFTVSPLANTTYSISGTSSDNCNSANQATGLITVNATPTISLLSITPSSSICAGQSVTITPTGANSNYTIMPLNTNNSTVFVVSPSVTTSYTISGSNTTGCLSTASTDLYTTITVNQTPSITIASQQNALCFGGASGSVTLTPTGGTGASTITPLSTTNLSVGNYTYTIIDDAGCENTTTVTITEPTNALASSVAEVSANANCTSPNGVASVTVTGGTPTYTIAWSTGEIGATATSLNTGLSTYTVIDANGCLDNTGSIVLTGVSGITTNAISQNSIACFGTNSGALSFTTTGGGTINYTLTNIATGINTTNTTGIFSGLTAGNYSLTVVGIGGCTTNQLLSLTQPTSAIVISSIVTNSIVCFGNTGIVTANVLGGTTPYTYAWQSNTSLTSTAIYEAGTYTMTVADANNCTTAPQTFTLAEPSNSLTITETLLSPSCNNENTGAIEITINGGTPNYTTLWSNGATTNAITQLPVGAITATVTDANNCASFYNATITETVCVTLNVPNFFTPEGDGKNDVLLITGIEQYPNNEVFIFNRWGSLVYSKEKYDNSFDGKPNVSNSNGNGKLPSATYFMIIEFNDNKTKPYKGYIEIKY